MIKYKAAARRLASHGSLRAPHAAVPTLRSLNMSMLLLQVRDSLKQKVSNLESDMADFVIREQDARDQLAMSLVGAVGYARRVQSWLRWECASETFDGADTPALLRFSAPFVSLLSFGSVLHRMSCLHCELSSN